MVDNAPTELQSIRELCIRMEGKLDRLHDGQTRTDDDLRQLRGRVHELSNEVAKIVALDLPGKFVAMKELESKVDKHDELAAEGRGAVAAAKVAYALGGSFIGAVITLVLTLAKVIHIQ